MSVMNSPSHVSAPGWPDTTPGRADRSDRPDRPGGSGSLLAGHRTHTEPDASDALFGDVRPGGQGVTPVSGVTREGAAWLVSAGTNPRTTLARWASNPAAPLVLPCGATFDVVNTPVFFGRRMLDQLWENGPGSGPVAVHRGRMLLFAAPGTAHRLPSLLTWEEWGTGGGRGSAVPPPLCHGPGDAVTVPPLTPSAATETLSARWLVAPATRRPWLPGPEVLLWACVRAVRAMSDPRGRTPNGQDARGTVIDFPSPRPGC
jgi:hypothetical protein